jgi:hypothetical protein
MPIMIDIKRFDVYHFLGPETGPLNLLGRPPSRPLGGDEAVVAFRTGRGSQLDLVLDLEAVRLQQPDPISMAEVELDRRFVRPLEPVHPERSRSNGQ